MAIFSTVAAIMTDGQTSDSASQFIDCVTRKKQLQKLTKQPVQSGRTHSGWGKTLFLGVGEILQLEGVFLVPVCLAFASFISACVALYEEIGGLPGCSCEGYTNVLKHKSNFFGSLR
jgi:hypothetical protein